jgi:phosphatidylglycerol:prolipoprotein diacylglycerol transferase
MKYPELNPVLFRIGALEARWYGLLYIIGFVVGYIFYRRYLKFRNISMTKEVYEEFIFQVMLGVILGGRLGYVLFYNLPYYFYHPLEIFAVWHGGMSFHGGALGVIILGWRFCRKNNYRFYQLADPVMPLIAIGLGLGRLGNFINGELYGRVTTVPWGMVFPADPSGMPRHPSQLYEAFLEGFLLWAITYLILRKACREGYVFWSWIGLYGIFRFLVEFVRQPDAHLGYMWGLFTRGQVLSSFMILAAVIGIIFIARRSSTDET